MTPSRFVVTAKADAYLIAFENWTHNRRPVARELRASTLDDLVGNQVPLTPSERHRARLAKSRRHA